MSLVDTNSLSGTDALAIMNRDGNNGWGDWSSWIIILVLFGLFGNGWGGFGVNGSGSDIQRGFDQASVMNGVTGLTSTVTNGFANAEVSRCNAQTNVLQTLSNNQMGLYQTLNDNQNANTAAMNALAMSLQNCCCENRAATADLKYAVATEACNDRAAVNSALQAITAQNNANTQRILDQMCADKIDQKNERIAELQNQLTMAQLNATQNAQTAAIIANNDAQTAALEQYLAPTPRPAYMVQNPNCCTQSNWNCCG